MRDDGFTHWLWLLHVAAGEYAPSVQVSLPQVEPTAYFSQLPIPSHSPSVPQVVCPWSVHIMRGSFAPVATLVQRPRLP